MKKMFVCLFVFLFTITAYAGDKEDLDAAVMSAISNGDLEHARQLAVTPQHWQWIHQAENGNTTSGSGTGYQSRAQVQQQMIDSQECQDARRHYQIEASLPDNASHSKRASVEAARMSVQAACGGIF